MKRRNFLQVACLAAAPAMPAWAQSSAGAWPERPVRWILSQPAGSGPDIVARMLAERLAQALGQAIVIDNKPGGQNVIGAQAAAKSAPDGYTFYFATTAALVTNRFLFKSLPYDPLADFAPVAFIANSPFALLVNADSPVHSIGELVTRSKSSPGTLTLANEGPRTFSGMIARLVNARAGMQANLVSYASVKTSIQDVLGGHAEAMVAGCRVQRTTRSRRETAHARGDLSPATRRLGAGTGPGRDARRRRHVRLVRRRGPCRDARADPDPHEP